MRQKQGNRLGQTAGFDPREKHATSDYLILPQPAGPRKPPRWVDLRWLQMHRLLATYLDVGAVPGSPRAGGAA